MYGPLKAKDIARNAANGIRSRPVSNADLRRADAHYADLQDKLGSYSLGSRGDRAKVAAAMAMLVGAVESFLKLSGQSLAQVVHKIIVNKGGNALNGPIKQAVGLLPSPPRVGRKVAAGGVKVAAVVIEGIPVSFVKVLLKIFLFKPYGLKPFSENRVADIIRRSKSTLAALIRGKDVPLGKLVRDVIMAMDAWDVMALLRSFLRSTLETYIYSPYKSTPSNAPGAMCLLCRQASDACKLPQRNSAAKNKLNSKELGRIVDEVLRAINMLLALEGRRAMTVSSVIYDALQTNMPAMMQTSTSTVVKAARKAGAAAIPVLAASLAPLASGYLSNTFGVGIDTWNMSRLMLWHWRALSTWLTTGKGAIEPFLVDMAKAVRPMGLVRGAAGVALNNKGGATSEFCAFCKSGSACK